MWVSVSNDLRKDAERDLQDILAGHVKTYPRVGRPATLPFPCLSFFLLACSIGCSCMCSLGRAALFVGS